jgi:uncharacterized cupredoxin-like copper-binding protein
MIMVQKALGASACIFAIGTIASMGLISPREVLAHGGHGHHQATRVFAAGQPGDPNKPFRTVTVVMTDDGGKMAYTPDRVDVTKGEQIKFILRNAGLVDHEFLIDTIANNARHKSEMEKNPEMEHDEPNGARLRPGATKEILWRVYQSRHLRVRLLAAWPLRIRHERPGRDQIALTGIEQALPACSAVLSAASAESST